MKFILFLLIIILGLFLISVGVYYDDEDNQPTYLQCGLILNKIDGAKYIEHKYDLEIEAVLYMDVRYDNNYVDRVEVTPNTYYKHEIGQRVCFIRHFKPSGWWGLVMVIGFIMICCCFIPYLLE